MGGKRNVAAHHDGVSRRVDTLAQAPAYELLAVGRTVVVVWKRIVRPTCPGNRIHRPVGSSHAGIEVYGDGNPQHGLAGGVEGHKVGGVVAEEINRGIAAIVSAGKQHGKAFTGRAPDRHANPAVCEPFDAQGVAIGIWQQDVVRHAICHVATDMGIPGNLHDAAAANVDAAAGVPRSVILDVTVNERKGA